LRINAASFSGAARRPIVEQLSLCDGIAEHSAGEALMRLVGVLVLALFLSGCARA
jgi:hypothetical protein